MGEKIITGIENEDNNEVDLQDKMFESILDEVGDHLSSGIGKITGEELEKKLLELFEESKDDDLLTSFEHRLIYVFESFESWLLEEKDRVKGEEVIEFCTPIFVRFRSEYVTRDLDNERDPKSADILPFKKED